MRAKEKKVVAIIVIIMLLIIGILYISKKNIGKKDEKKEIVIGTLADIFPSKEGAKIEYKEGDTKHKVKVEKIEEKEEAKEVTISYQEGKTTIEKTYEIQAEKVIEKGRILEDGKEVSIIYPLEIIVGMPYEGQEWKSVDELTINRVTKMKNGKIIIESTRKIETVENEKLIEKTLKEVRTYEKEKGLIEYNTSII